MTRLVSTIVLILLFTSSLLYAQNSPSWKKVKALIYTRNGKGYKHDNIPFAVAALQKLANQYGFAADTTSKPDVFTKDELKKYSLLIFTSTNNDVFDTDEQRLAFRQYIQGGGGFVGIHSVVGTERNWKWFKTLLGGTFVWHPSFQKYKIEVIDPKHPSMEGLPAVWEKEDECYFMKEMYPGIHTVMAHDLTSLDTKDKEKITANAGPFTNLYPAAWHHQFDGGYVWITALGHHKKDYEDPLFLRHIINGIKFIAGQARQPDYSRSYATTRDDLIR
jgi:uncharacterized protein